MFGITRQAGMRSLVGEVDGLSWRRVAGCDIGAEDFEGAFLCFFFGGAFDRTAWDDSATTV